MTHQIIDGKVIFGSISTAFTGALVWIQDAAQEITTIISPSFIDYVDAFAPLIPLIPAIPTAIYMLVRAYNAFQAGRIERKENK